MRRVMTGRLSVAYQEVGEGPPLILLHGGLCTAQAWSEVIPWLNGQFRVIAPDTRGHGGTPNLDGALSYRQLGEDTAALIAALRLDRPLVVGWSDGGQAALELAMRLPGLAGGLVIGGVWFQFSPAYQASNQRLGFPGVGQVELSRFDATALAREHGADRWQRLLQEISTLFWTPLEYTCHDFQAVQDPCLIVVGDRDEFIPVEEAVALHRALPTSALAVIPNADHGLPQSHPQVFAETVKAFYRSKMTLFR